MGIYEPDSFTITSITSPMMLNIQMENILLLFSPPPPHPIDKCEQIMACV